MFAEVLNEITLKQNITQSQLQHSSGISQETLSRFMSGARRPGYEDIATISNSLGVSPSVFFPHSKHRRYEFDFSTYEEFCIPFSCGILYSVFSDPKNMMAVINLSYTIPIESSPICPLYKVSDKTVTTIVVVTNGKMSFEYDFGFKEIPKYSSMKIKGFEKSFSVEPHTSVSFIVSGLKSTIIKDTIINLARGKCSCNLR